MNKIDPNFFQVGKLYEWKEKNSFVFHLYDHNREINYSDCKAMNTSDFPSRKAISM